MLIYIKLKIPKLSRYLSKFKISIIHKGDFVLFYSLVIILETSIIISFNLTIYSSDIILSIKFS